MKEQKNRGNEQGKKVVMIGAAVFIILLIPLYLIGIYAHPCVDDYFYGTDTAKVWKLTHSFMETCKMSLENTKQVYRNWQGNFSGIFLMGLQPGIFGEKQYVWTTIIILTTFIGTNLFFYYQLMMKILKKNKIIISILSMMITMAALQFTYMPSDSFYWYNGSIYYTFFYSLSLLLFGNILWKKNIGAVGSWVITVISGVLGFFIGGSNYSTALVSVVILFCVNFYSGAFYIQKRKQKIEIKEEEKKALRNVIENSVIFLMVFSGFLISVFAPGNAVRQASVGGSNSVIKSVFLSFCYGGYNIASATTLPVVCIWLMLLPLLWKIIPKDKAEECSKGDRIKIMWGKIGLLFCIFSAQSTPVFYAQGIRIPYRLMNIIYFSYYTFGLLVWIILLKELKQSCIWNDISEHFRKKEINRERKCGRYYYGGLLILLLAALIGNIKIIEKETEKGKVEIGGLPITAEAMLLLANGDAKGYSDEADLRVMLYENEKVKKVRVKPFEHQPYLLYHSDITTDKKHWKNKHVSKYYNKQYVVLFPEK